MTRTLKLLTVLCIAFLFVQCGDDNEVDPTPETVTDADGNIYQTITIGDQVWMAENLKVTKFNDGTDLTKWEFGNTWYNANNVEFNYQWAETGDLNNIHANELPEDYYGAIYNEHVLASGKLAPEGWRIPTEQDFKNLEAFLASDGHTGNEAVALKSMGSWVTSSGDGTDDYGFRVLPNGYAAAGGTATGSQVIATLATSITNSTEQTRTVLNIYNEPTISFANNSWALGAGVRCIKE